jgi:hypothetical protein
MFTDLGLVGEETPVVAVVHDCQVVHEKLHPSPTDILVDHIATPAGLHTVDRRAKRPHGVIWDLLEPKQIEQTPPLQELRQRAKHKINDTRGGWNDTNDRTPELFANCGHGRSSVGHATNGAGSDPIHDASRMDQ